MLEIDDRYPEYARPYEPIKGRRRHGRLTGNESAFMAQRRMRRLDMTRRGFLTGVGILIVLTVLMPEAKKELILPKVEPVVIEIEKPTPEPKVIPEIKEPEELPIVIPEPKPTPPKPKPDPEPEDEPEKAEADKPAEEKQEETKADKPEDKQDKPDKEPEVKTEKKQAPEKKSEGKDEKKQASKKKRRRKPSMSMNKAELIKAAENRGISVPEGATKRDILDLIYADKDK